MELIKQTKKGNSMKTQDDVINIKISREALEATLEVLKESMLPYHWHAKKAEVTEALEQALANSIELEEN